MPPHIKRLAAYGFIVLLFFIGLWRVETTARDVAREAETRARVVRQEVKERQIANCKITNKNRKDLLDIIDLSASTTYPDELLEQLTPEMQQLIAFSQQNAKEFRLQAAEILQLQDCSELD